MTACPIATQSPGHGCMDDLTNELSFYSKATWVNWCAWLISLTSYPLVFHNQTLADIWSTGARIKCLYCIYHWGNFSGVCFHCIPPKIVCIQSWWAQTTLCSACTLSLGTTTPYSPSCIKYSFKIFGLSRIFYFCVQPVMQRHLLNSTVIKKMWTLGRHLAVKIW